MTARKSAQPSATEDWEVAPSATSKTRKPKAITLPRAMALAREAMPDITAQPMDGIASSERDGEGWRIVTEVIEAPARMGNNDLLAAYELTLDAEGELTGFRRLRRYHREDRDT